MRCKRNALSNFDETTILLMSSAHVVGFDEGVERKKCQYFGNSAHTLSFVKELSNGCYNLSKLEESSLN
jgi:hypothetical protein